MRVSIAIIIGLIIVIAGCTTSQQSSYSAKECVSSWSCTEWSQCQRIGITTGSQNRTCSDASMCNATADKPPESQECTMLPTTSKEPNEIALELHDFAAAPTNWTLKERVERTKNDLNDYPKSLGWEKGFRVIYYTGQEPNIGYISQHISYYPRENVTKLLDKNNPNSTYFSLYNITVNNSYYVFDDLSDPKAGEKSIGYRFTKLIGDGAGTSYQIAFYRLNVVETLIMSDGAADYELLKDLARKAADKIV